MTRRTRASKSTWMTFGSYLLKETTAQTKNQEEMKSRTSRESETQAATTKTRRGERGRS